MAFALDIYRDHNDARDDQRYFKFIANKVSQLGPGQISHSNVLLHKCTEEDFSKFHPPEEEYEARIE